MDGHPWRAHCRLVPNPEAAATARRQVGRLTRGLREVRRSDAELLVSEVVTNALRHSGVDAHGSIDLQIVRSRRGLRVEVRDPGPGFICGAPALPDPDEAGGRGLYLVAALADRWGVEREGRTLVWFEIEAEL